jgi:hypothetical protein
VEDQGGADQTEAEARRDEGMNRVQSSGLLLSETEANLI